MTRGKIVGIFEDKILSSIEFNGNMYLEDYGHGQEIIDKLPKIHTEKEYREYVKDFNDRKFKYEEEDLCYDVEDYLEQCGLGENYCFDFIGRKYYDMWFSDYLYIKNFDNNPVILTIKQQRLNDYDEQDKELNYKLQPNEIIVLHFGRYEMSKK